jgi:ferric-dicitrate binding protein FerR (iron transport regulator)
MTERDDDRLDLSAWESPTPPRGMANRVMDAVRATGDVPDVRPSTRATPSLRTNGGRNRVLLGLAAVAAAAALTWALWPRPHTGAPSTGHVLAAAPSKIALGDGTIALLTAGADVTWERHGARLDITQSAGTVTYQHPGPGGLVVTTPLATIHTASASMNVEVPMSNKKVAIAGVGGAAIAAAVVVAVYEGRAEVRQPATSPQVVEAGGQVAVAAPPAKPAFTPVAKTVKDRAKHDEIAAAIAQARAARTSGVAGGGGGSLPGGSALAPDPGAPPTVDLTPGELSKEEIRTSVREVVPLLTECYSLLLEKYPHVGGRVTAKLVVESEPDVGTIVTMQENESKSDMKMVLEAGQSPKDFGTDMADFNQCLTATLESVAMPPLGDKDGGRVEINYPFVFAPSEEEAEQYNPDGPKPMPEPARPTQKKATPTSDAPRPADPNATPDDLLAESEDAAKASQWALALRRAEDAIEHPRVSGQTKARGAMVAALAACNLKIADKAKRYFWMATPSSKSLVEQRCLKNGIDVAGRGTVAPKPAGDGVMNPFAPR